MRIHFGCVQTGVSRLGHTLHSLLRMRMYHVKALTGVSLCGDILQSSLCLVIDLRTV